METNDNDFRPQLFTVNLDGSNLTQIPSGISYAYEAVWSPDGTRIATASRDYTAYIWDANTGVELFTLAGHQFELADVAWSPDGNYVITGSNDGTARIWRVWQSTGDLIDYAEDCCVVRQLTPEEREQFNLS
jgi:WD40 repeat protein